MKTIICILTHKIKTLSNCLFIDKVSGKSVGEFECKKCGRFMANSKFNLFRVYQ